MNEQPWLERGCQRYALVDVPAAIDPVGGPDANTDRLTGGKYGAHGIKDLQRKTHTVLQQATILVGALIGNRRHELVQQITMGSVNLDCINTQAHGALRGGDKRILNAAEGCRVKSQRSIITGGKRYGKRRQSLPTAFGNGNVGVSADGTDDLAERDLRFVRIKPKVGVGDATLRLYGGGFRKQYPRAGKRHVPEMDHVPVGRLPVLGRVFAHGRNGNTISQSQLVERKRGK